MGSKEKLEVLKSIVKNCAAGELDGELVDLFSASACLKVANALSPENRDKFLELPAGKMAETAFRILG